MNQSVKGEESSAGKRRRPRLLRGFCQPEETQRNNEIRTSDVTDEVRIRRPRRGNTWNRGIPFFRSGEHPERICTQSQPEN